MECRGVPKAERQAAVDARREAAADRGAARPPAERAFRRAAPARRHGPRAGARPGAVPVRRALSNLDAKLRVEMRMEIKRLHQRTRHHGRLRDPRPDRGDDARHAHCGDACAARSCSSTRREAIYDTPANLFVAGFMGSPPMNFIAGSPCRGQRRGDRASRASPRRTCHCRSAPTRSRRGSTGRRCSAFDPKRSRSAASGPTRVHAKVEMIEPTGAETMALLELRGNRDRRAHGCGVAPRRGLDRGVLARLAQGLPVRSGNDATVCVKRFP